MLQPGTGSRVARSLALAYLAATVAFAVGVSAIALRDHFTVANADDWRIYHDMFSLPLGEWLFRPQNGHQVPATLALLYLDYEYFRGEMRLLVGVSLACALLASVILWRACRRDGELSRPLVLAGVSFAIFALYAGHGGYAFLWGMMQGNLQLALFLVAGIAALLRARSFDSRSAPRWVALACAMAAGATFSHGAGFATWAALVGVAVAARFPVRMIVWLHGAAAVTLAIYLWELRGTSEATAVGTGAVSEYLSFAAAMVGSAPARVGHDLGIIAAGAFHSWARVLGAGGILFAAAALSRFRWGPRPAATWLTGFGLMSFGAGTAALVAIVRASSLGDQGQSTSLRFIHFSSFFWSGLVLAGTSDLGRLTRPWIAIAGIAVLIAVSAASIPAYREIHRERLVHNDMLEDAAFELLAGAGNKATALRVSLRRPDVFFGVADRLREDGRNLFGGDRAELVGRFMNEKFEVLEESVCEGAATWLSLVPARNREVMAHTGGWGRIVETGEPIPLIVLVDNQEQIRGLGRPSTRARSFPEPREGQWTGTIGQYRPRRTRYSAWGIVDNRSACWLGMVPISRQSQLRPLPGELLGRPPR